MQDFITGQRWINDAQLQMGLGTVLTTDFRTVTIIFLATNETFVYAKESVPLTRVRFVEGDTIRSVDGVEIIVTEIAEESGLLKYTGANMGGESVSISESELDNLIQLSRPTERIFNGQIDRDRWFDIRFLTRLKVTEQASHSIRRLTGCRVNLIPHQLYIANEVANRYAPRVLLADEVGLGKTIEAGMILHHQIVTERVRRVLIVVPESLMHQWLVEMLRRFNLLFKIFDEERCASIDHADESDQINTENPFLSEQLVLCSLDFLAEHPDRYAQCLEAEWDLLVVDEAHHLEWSAHHPSHEYKLIEALANHITGVLLLTATPEQLGKESHFARLRLLDQEKFSDYETFLQSEQHYAPIAHTVESMLSRVHLDDEARSTLEQTLGDDALAIYQSHCGENKSDVIEDSSEIEHEEKATDQVVGLVDQLLDHHGTGRVLFRNTRSAVKGFPDRRVITYPMEIPEPYQQVLDLVKGNTFSEAQLLLCPELLFQVIDESHADNWVHIDPRIDQLIEILRDVSPSKVLVITASAGTALDIVEVLRIKTGISAAVFHEEMSLLDRDKSAAWFGDQIAGTQVMVCSEIGSEGRNFQFSHHLVLFDLPLNPDLLEQRIGRLDRIGQTETIKLHVMYLKNTAQEIMYRWYHEGLNAFEKTCPTGHDVFVNVKEHLIEALHRPRQVNGSHQNELIDVTKEYNGNLEALLQDGRDRLLEYSSCRPVAAEQIKQLALESDDETGLQSYIETVFDCFGVDYEPHSEGCFAINAGTHMLTPFPNLPEDGMTVTYDRELALTYEDVEFLTWDHPLVVGAMDLVLSGELGNTSVIAIPINGVKPGTILLESIYVLESASTDTLQSARYLPPTVIRILIDQTGKKYDDMPTYNTTENPVERVKKELAKRLVLAKESLLRKMVLASEKLANHRAPKILEKAHQQTQQTLLHEIERLNALIKINPNVRKEEIQFFEQQYEEMTQRLSSASVRLDAMRIIVAKQ